MREHIAAVTSGSRLIWARQGILILLGMLIVGASSSEAAAATVRARYSVSYLGIQVGEVTVVNTIGPSGYDAHLNAHLTGAAVVAGSFKVNMKASGIVRNAAILPSSFSSSQSGSETRTVRISLVAGDVGAIEIIPPFERKGSLVLITEEHKRQVVDPLSALIMPLSSGDRRLEAACNRTLRLFTGAARSDVEFTHLKTDQVRSKAYSGPVAVCSMRYMPVAGHDPASSMTKFMEANQEIEARLGLLQNGPFAMLVSATIPLPLGTAVVRIKHYELVPALEDQSK